MLRQSLVKATRSHRSSDHTHGIRGTGRRYPVSIRFHPLLAHEWGRKPRIEGQRPALERRAARAPHTSTLQMLGATGPEVRR